MTLLNITYLPAAVAISAIQVLESAVLTLRKGQGSVRNLYFAVVEIGFGFISVWEVLDPKSPATRPVAVAYLAYLTVATTIGHVLLRSAGWQYKHKEPLRPFPLELVVINLVLVSAFFTYTLRALQA